MLELPPPPDQSRPGKNPGKLEFRGGAPLVPVRLMEGQTEIAFVPRSRMVLRLGGNPEKRVSAPGGSEWRIRVRDGTPARTIARVQLAEFPLADREGIAAAEEEWAARGFKVRTHALGAVFGVAGKVIDNRRILVLVDTAESVDDARKRQASVLREYAIRTTLFEEVEAPASATLELVGSDAQVIGSTRDPILAETTDEAGFDVRRVEFGVGYDSHGFENRSYRGAIEVSADRQGKLAVVNLVSVEDLLKGLVPSEIFSRAHFEALKAQAVTARGEVLAKVGTKHLADPYLLCSEQHCAVYKGLSGETQATNAAVEATRGEGLFSQDGRLVDSVYSAVCGGHTENNEAVWGGVPNSNLRGKPDLIGPDAGLASPSELATFLDTTLPAACRLSSFAQPPRYRWERRFSAVEVDALTQDLRIGPVQAITVTDRGVSGRARILTLSGETGATQVRGELNIRKRFRNLNSSMFVVRAERTPEGKIAGWVFKGGGWGHGVGMCQTGAIGRAEAGESYREILRFYFSGAEVSKIY